MPVSLYTWTPLDGVPAASNYPAFATVNAIPLLSFAAGVTQTVVFDGVIPRGVDLSSGLNIVLNWVSPSATTGNVNWGVAYERLGVASVSGDNFGIQIAQATTVNAVVNISSPVTINIPYSNMNSSVPGDAFRIQLQRVAGAADTMAGPAQLLTVHAYVTPLPSPNNTTIPPATQIIDSSLNVWTVVGGQVYQNNMLAGYSAGVVELAIVGGVIWQNNGTNWYSWTGTTWALGGYPFGTITIGQTIIQNGADGGNANLLLAQKTTLTQNATLTSLSFYVTTAAGNLVLGVYSDAGGVPGTLIGQTASFVPVVGWNTQPVPGSHALTPGTYWLAYWPNNNGLSFTVGTGLFYDRSLAFTGTMPSSFAQTGTGAGQWSFYATLTPTLSPSGTTVPPAQSIVDSHGDYWTIVSSQVYKDGLAAGNTPNAVELAYVTSVVWYTDSSGNWFQWTGSAWTAGADPILTESPNNTTVPPATQIVDAGFNLWTIRGGQVYENGALAGSTSSVQQLAYVNHVVWQENTSLNWWSWNGTTWVSGSNPLAGSGGGSKPGLMLFGGVMDFNNNQLPSGGGGQGSYQCPDPLWKPIANGAASGNQFPSNWWRMDNVEMVPWGGTAAQWGYSTLGPIWLSYCQNNKVNGPCIQLWYPGQIPVWYPSGQAAINFYTADLDALAPYMPAGTYQIIVNEFLSASDQSAGFLNNPTVGQGGGNILAALGGTGTTGYDGLIAFIKLTRQHLPGALLGLNEVAVCSFEATTAGSTNNYNATQAINCYRICASNGAALDWLGCEGYGLAGSPGGTTASDISIINSTLNNVGSQLITTKGTGAPSTIAYTECTPGSEFGGWGPFNSQYAFWTQFLPMLAANQYCFGMTGPWAGFRRSNQFGPNRDWLYDDTTAGGVDPDGVGTSNGHITATLTYMQGWATPTNVHN